MAILVLVLSVGAIGQSISAEAKRIGLNKEDFIRKATDYVQRMKTKADKS